MLRIFFLVLSQLTVGGFALLSLVPLRQIGKGFFRTCALLYLLIMALVLAGLEWTRPWELLGFVLFFLLLVVYIASLWSERLPDSRQLLPITLAVGAGAVFASALSYASATTAAWEMSLRAVNFVLSALSLGAAMTGMLLGHWYLVTPELSLVPIKRLTGVLLASLIMQGGLLTLALVPELGALPATLAPKVQHLMAAYPYFLLGRVLVGLVGTFGLAVLTMWLLREGSTQAATGFLYTAVLTVTVGELIARFLFRLTGVPV
jgi:DMSO reductase anchor subunit